MDGLREPLYYGRCVGNSSFLDWHDQGCTNNVTEDLKTMCSCDHLALVARPTNRFICTLSTYKGRGDCPFLADTLEEKRPFGFVPGRFIHYSFID